MSEDLFRLDMFEPADEDDILDDVKSGVSINIPGGDRETLNPAIEDCE